MKKLGFGCMRLPLTNPEDPTSVDLKQFCEMIDTFMDNGFTYFDTAYPYHQRQSELFGSLTPLFTIDLKHSA